MTADDISANSHDICDNEKEVRPPTGTHEPIKEPEVEMMAEEGKINTQELNVPELTNNYGNSNSESIGFEREKDDK